jgi:hypothetical protein
MYAYNGDIGFLNASAGWALKMTGNNAAITGTVTAPTFSGALSGNASTATYAATAGSAPANGGNADTTDSQHLGTGNNVQFNRLSIGTAPYGAGMQSGTLEIGRTDTNYAYTTGWSASNQGGILANALDNWEFVIHDSGDRLASPFAFFGGATNVLQIGRDLGWGVTPVRIMGNLNVVGTVTAPTFSGALSGNATSATNFNNGTSYSSGGNVYATTFSGALSGNATSATTLTGLTSTVAELNILDGVTGVTPAELSYVGDVTGLIQAQLNLKAPLASPTFTGNVKTSGVYYSGASAGVSGSMRDASLDYCDGSYFTVGYRNWVGGIYTGTSFSGQGSPCSFDGDIAEYYGTQGALPVRGDIVALTNTTTSFVLGVSNPAPGEAPGTTYTNTTSKVTKATSDMRNLVIGVVPTSPGQILGTKDKMAADSNPQLVAIAGHVPVRMTLDGGDVAIGDPITISSTTPGAGMKATTSGRILGYALNNFTATYNGEDGSGMIEVYINPDDWIAPQELSIDAGGNVGIGTTTIGSRLVIKGSTTDNTASGLNVTDSNDVSKLYVRNDGNVGIGTADPGIYKLNINGTGYLGAAAWVYSSDQRLKENISYLENNSGISSLDKILQLKPARFDYIVGEKNQLGFIAQDVQQVIPEAVVVTNPTTGMLGLKTDFMIPYLVGAIQEQQTQIENISGLGIGNGIAIQGNIGIGTSNPTAKLEIVDGNIQITNGTLIVGGINLLEKTDKIFNDQLSIFNELSISNEKISVQTQGLASLQLKTEGNATTISELEIDINEQLAIVGGKLDDLIAEDATINKKISNINDQLLSFATLQSQIDDIKTQSDTITSFLNITDGNFNLMDGTLEAAGVVAGAFAVKAVEDKPQTIGTAFICPIGYQGANCIVEDAGNLDGQSVFVDTKVGAVSAITATAKIFINFENNPEAYSWTEKETDEAGAYTGKFKIRIDKETTTPVKVNWWIVESE